VEGYADWFYSAQWPGHRFVPDSCCDNAQFSDERGAMTNCGKAEGNEHVFHKSGCSVMFTDWLLQHLAVVGVLSLLFVIVEIFVLLSSLRLIWHLRSREKFARTREPSYRYAKDGQTLRTEGHTGLMTSE